MNAQGPLVSITIPSFNQGQYLEETILSVLNQNYHNLEILVMDGGSNDNSVEIIKKYESKLTFWESKPDHGQSDAINKGWMRSRGEILAWINSDDILMPNAINSAVNYFHFNPEIDFLFSDIYRIDINSSIVNLSRYKDFNLTEMIKKVGYISQPGNFLRRNLFEKIGLLDENLHFLMDFDYWLRAGLYCNFGHLKEPLAAFRVQPNSKTSSKMVSSINELDYVYNKFFHINDLPEVFKKNQKESRSNVELKKGYIYFGCNELEKASEAMMLAFKLWPKIVFFPKFSKLLIRVCLKKLIGENKYQGLRGKLNELNQSR